MQKPFIHFPYLLALATCLAFAVPLLPDTLHAQTGAPTGRGVIKGKITDDKGEGLIGATAKLKGTYYGAAADIDGNFTVRGINPGQYTLEISLVGYASIQRTGINLDADETLTFNFTLKEASVTAQEVTVIGARPLIDIEQSKSASIISTDIIAAQPLTDIKDLAATQVGVTQTPYGINIRGGRSYETGFLLDGVSAKDPLSGTGFGLNLSTSSFEEVEVTTGSSGAEYGNAPAGVVNVKIKEGGDKFEGAFEHRRDGFGTPWRAGWNTSAYEGSISGPIELGKVFRGFPGELGFFASLNAQFHDEFFNTPAQRLQSSVVSDFFAPFNDNKWDGLLKLTYKLGASDKFTLSVSRSIAVNQNTRMLQVTGNDIQLSPGYQYDFSQLPDNANTYTSDINLQVLKWTHTLSKYSFLTLQASRLFVQLRSEANGRPFRPDFINEDLDPRSIITDPQYVNPNDSVVFTFPSDGFINTGIAPLWHDHRVTDYTFSVNVNLDLPDGVNRFLFGTDETFSDYQWIDIDRPWVGAPLTPGEPSRQLGVSADVWRVQPTLGAIYASDNIKYKGLIATIGLRLQYWFPGKFVDDAINDPLVPVPQAFRDDYQNSTIGFFGSRMKLRLMPRINISFPVADNQVLYLNYGHSSNQPQARTLYRSLDTRYIDNNFSSPVGNPSLDPETTVSYELGLKTQLSKDDALTLTAFYNDKFDYIVSTRVATINPRTGGDEVRQSWRNEDYARIRGVEASYKKRIGSWFDGTISAAYQIATGKSNSAEETQAAVRNTGERPDRETYLAWDRPLEVKGNVLLRHKAETGLFGIGALNNLKLFVSATFNSGLRYTPQVPVVENGQLQYVNDNPNGRLLYREDETDGNRFFSKAGSAWFNIDLNLEKAFDFAGVSAVASLQVRNVLNNKNAAIVNPATGRAYEPGDPLPDTARDPAYPDFQDRGLPPSNPARYLAPTNVTFGVALKF